MEEGLGQVDFAETTETESGHRNTENTARLQMSRAYLISFSDELQP